jgi:hypothetical protein
MANDNMKHRRLQELDESDFEIVDGQPDIRGWDVKTGDQTIGEVDELILDARERKVRYMVVDLDDDALDLEDDRKVLIPIGMAQLHEKDDDVILPGISVEQLRQLPEYDRDNLTDKTEYAISTVLGRTGLDQDAQWNSGFYQHEHFNEGNLYQRRLPASTSASGGSAYLQSRQGNNNSESEDYIGRDSNRLYSSDRNSVNEEIEDNVLSPVSNRQNELNDRFSDDSDDDLSDNDRDRQRRNRRDEDDGLRSGL